MLDGLSIGFTVNEYVAGTKPDEPRRTIKKVDLWELSLVTFPANSKALISEVKNFSDGRAILSAEANARA